MLAVGTLLQCEGAILNVRHRKVDRMQGFIAISDVGDTLSFMKQDRVWLPFVILSIVCALLPGFGLGAVLGSARVMRIPIGSWYLATVQAHATALLLGWGGAMIFGVALHFLPRLRGTALVGRKWVPAAFWLLAAGLAIRVIGQPTLAVLEQAESGKLAVAGRIFLAAGILFQVLGVAGVMAVLVATFRSGPPLEKRKGFREIAPLLVVAAIALGFAQLVWLGGAVENLWMGRSLAVFPIELHQIAVDLCLFGFISAISVGMSSRLFPLNFRVRLPQVRLLGVAAGLLAVGIGMTLGSAFDSRAAVSGWPWEGLAALFFAAGLAFGAGAVRIFQPRTPYPGNKRPYRLWDNPASVAALFSYIWVVVAVVCLLLFAGQELGGFTFGGGWKDAARHATGAGFMTLLIVAAGWKMLPGFAGGRCRGDGYVWAAVVLLNLAALLRVLPSLLSGINSSGSVWISALFPLAGIAGFFGILAFSVALILSLRK